MRDREIDDVLKCAAGVSPEVDRELLGRIAGNLGASLQPVRPVSSVSAFVAALVAVCVATASVSATILGLHGIYALGAVRIALIFPILVALDFSGRPGLCGRNDSRQSASRRPFGVAGVGLCGLRRRGRAPLQRLPDRELSFTGGYMSEGGNGDRIAHCRDQLVDSAPRVCGKLDRCGGGGGHPRGFGGVGNARTSLCKFRGPAHHGVAHISAGAKRLGGRIPCFDRSVRTSKSRPSAPLKRAGHNCSRSGTSHYPLGDFLIKHKRISVTPGSNVLLCEAE